MRVYVNHNVKTTCKICGKELILSQSKFKKSKDHFCGHECFNIERRRRGVENGTILKLTCDYCKEEFFRQRSKKVFKNNYCNKECRDAAHKFIPEVKVCEYCHKDFLSRRLSDGTVNRFCSSDCFHSYLEEHKKYPDEGTRYPDKICAMAKMLGNAPGTLYRKVVKLKLPDEDLDRIVDPKYRSMKGVIRFTKMLKKNTCKTQLIPSGNH
jgi:hypothetical protein